MTTEITCSLSKELLQFQTCGACRLGSLAPAYYDGKEQRTRNKAHVSDFGLQWPTKPIVHSSSPEISSAGIWQHCNSFEAVLSTFSKCWEAYHCIFQ